MRLDTCDIVDHDDAMCAAVVGRGDCAKTLLSCCVPDLELDCFPIELKCADFLGDASEWKASEEKDNRRGRERKRLQKGESSFTNNLVYKHQSF